jgi:hypothetical protein
MPAPAHLAFEAGRTERHRVEAAVIGEDGVAIALDGAPRATVRAADMRGGFAFEVGGQRVEILFVQARPPGLEASVDGLPVRLRPRRGPDPSLWAAMALGAAGAVFFAYGAARLGAVGLAVGAALCAAAAALLWVARGRRLPERAAAPEGGTLVGRCSVHGDDAFVECARCQRALCRRCPAYRRADRWWCEHCA